jgi:hypothetical protein
MKLKILEKETIDVILNGEHKTVKVSQELGTIIPEMLEEKRQLLKDSIEHEHGILKPVDVAVLTDQKEGLYLIDGYNRSDIALELGQPIPANEIAGMSLQRAKEYSIEINIARRHLEAWDAALWGINVYIGEITQEKELSKEKANLVAARAGVARVTVERVFSTIKYLIRLKESNPQKESEYQNKLHLGAEKTENENGKSIKGALKELISAENVDSDLSKIEDSTFREEMEVKYATSKFRAGAEKKLANDIERHDHPEIYENMQAPKFTEPKKKKGKFPDNKGQTYDEFVRSIREMLEHVEKDYEDNICIMTITETEDYNEASNWIKKQAAENRGYTCVCFFYTSKEALGL